MEKSETSKRPSPEMFVAWRRGTSTLDPLRRGEPAQRAEKPQHPLPPKATPAGATVEQSGLLYRELYWNSTPTPDAQLTSDCHLSRAVNQHKNAEQTGQNEEDHPCAHGLTRGCILMKPLTDRTDSDPENHGSNEKNAAVDD
ncbi:MAG: hypothetical protein ACFCU1_01125 [Sumerlaeia bacterium]